MPSVRAMTRPGNHTRNSLTFLCIWSGSETARGNSSNAAEIRSRLSIARASSMLDARTHRHPIVPTRTRMVSRSAARSQMINTLGCIRTGTPGATGPVPVVSFRAIARTRRSLRVVDSFDNRENTLFRIKVKTAVVHCRRGLFPHHRSLISQPIF